MSKESPKKSSKPASRSPIRKHSRTSNKTEPQTELRKTRPAAASKTTRTPASQRAASKRLNYSETAVPAKKTVPAGPTEGAAAPAFRLPRDGGGTVSLSQYAGRKLVLFFFPRADTPGCTREAIDFTRLADDFAAAETALLGISSDPPKAQEAFRDKHGLAIPLASDEAHQVLLAYGAWGTKSMYGKTFEGVLRTTFLIDRDGRIARIWRNVRVEGHAAQVLAAAKAL